MLFIGRSKLLNLRQQGNVDKFGNSSNYSAPKVSAGLTGSMTEAIPVKLSYETESKTPSNTLASFSVGAALLVGFEAKIEIKSKN